MFKGVIGFIEPSQERPWPLAPEGRMRFRSSSFHTLGYFSLLAPLFESYARRDSSSGIWSLNVLIVLRGSDFKPLLEALAVRRDEINTFPHSWRDFLGEVHPPRGAPIVRMEPLLFRSRAMRAIKKIETALQVASETGRHVVYGSGVSYRHLCGISLPPGTVEYS
jgi:hypothetical protein